MLNYSVAELRINVKRNKQGKLVYTLRDAPSLTGTFLNNEILGDKDRVRIEEGAIVTIGATTFILHTGEILPPPPTMQ